MGAIASGGIHVVNQSVVEQLNITHEQISEVAATELIELERRERAYRGNRPAPQLRDQTVILVDDGLATGSTMLAAVKAVQEQAPARVVVAAPVAALETCEKFQQQVDEVICVQTPQPFYSVGSWYDNFSQTSDDEVRQLLANANGQRTLR
jgi:putative phosphoribosyl transferase